MADDPKANPPGGFPPTRLSVLLDARADDPSVRSRSLEILAEAYWSPIYKHLRLRWRKSAPDAEELTQSFFAAALERDFFAAYDATKARFRTFVRVSVDRLAQDEQKAGARQKRGGGARPLSWDVAGAEAELVAASPEDDVEAAFDRDFRRSLFRLALTSLRAELAAKGQERHARVFESYDLAPSDARPSYDALAEELGIKVTDVTYSLHFARRSFRRHVRERLRELVASEDEYELEARALGVLDASP